MSSNDEKFPDFSQYNIEESEREIALKIYSKIYPIYKEVRTFF